MVVSGVIRVDPVSAGVEREEAGKHKVERNRQRRSGFKNSWDRVQCFWDRHHQLQEGVGRFKRRAVAIGPCLGTAEEHDLDGIEADIPVSGNGDFPGQWRGRRIGLGLEVIPKMDLDVGPGEHCSSFEGWKQGAGLAWACRQHDGVVKHVANEGARGVVLLNTKSTMKGNGGEDVANVHIFICLYQQGSRGRGMKAV